LAAGICEAAVRALKQTRAVRGRMLSMLSRIFKHLPKESRPAPMAELVGGNVVEVAVAHTVEAGLDISKYGLDMFKYFFKDPAARERVCDPAMAGKLVKWAAEWLPLVRDAPG
jgi:hypothetical protein